MRQDTEQYNAVTRTQVPNRNFGTSAAIDFGNPLKNQYIDQSNISALYFENNTLIPFSIATVELASSLEIASCSRPQINVTEFLKRDSIDNSLTRLISESRALPINENDIATFSHKIAHAILNSDQAGIDLLQKKLAGNEFSIDIVSAICDSLGRLEETKAKNIALNILTFLLGNSIAETRDEATLGLVLLNDRRCIPALEQSLIIEKNSMVKFGIEQAIEQIAI